jgi:hypothetical protein
MDCDGFVNMERGFFFFLGVNKSFITQTQQNNAPEAWKLGSNNNQTQNHKQDT